jgi:hypothetical protein
LSFNNFLPESLVEIVTQYAGMSHIAETGSVPKQNAKKPALAASPQVASLQYLQRALGNRGDQRIISHSTWVKLSTEYHQAGGPADPKLPGSDFRFMLLPGPKVTNWILNLF